MFNTFHLKNW